jgi:hypothetical protein
MNATPQYKQLSPKRLTNLIERVCRSPAVYGLCDPGDASGTIRYVGYSNFPARRLEQHVEGKATRNLGMQRWLAGLRLAGLRPEMRILEYTTDQGWAEAERRHIAAHRALPTGHLLLNIEDGGPSPRSKRGNKPGKTDKRKAAKAAKLAALAIVKARRTAKHEWNRRENLRLRADPNWLGGPK